LENYGLLPDGRSGMLPFPSSRNARQFYIKLKYLLDF
jgi:hypothetical protein